MEEKKNGLNNLLNKAKTGLEQIDVDSLKSNVSNVTSAVISKAGEAKDKAIALKDDINEKLTELDRMLEKSVTDYNDAYTSMSDKGLQLYIERTRSVDTIEFIESMINSIANKPKSFSNEFEEIEVNKKEFTSSCEFAERELKDARNAAVNAGVGLAAGSTVAFMAPTAAMWVATTFGTASTGTAISALTGVAAQSAALAWLGGGSLAAGGGGMIAGKAFLALAGPVGWSIAGATLLTTIVLFASKKSKNNKEKFEEILKVKENTEKVKEMDRAIDSILAETSNIRSNLNTMLKARLNLYGTDYLTLSDDNKQYLGALVNNTKSLSALFGRTVSQ